GVAVLGHRMGAIVADMRDAQIVLRSTVAGIDAVELRRGVVRGSRPLLALPGLIWRRRRHEADAAFAERPFEWRKRHLGIMRPAIRRAIAERLIIVADALQIGDRLIVLRCEAEAVLRPAHDEPLARAKESKASGRGRH